MSFKFGFTSRKDRIASRFLRQVHAALSQAAVEVKADQGLTQADVARELNVHRALVSRILSGAGNPTVRTIGELAGVLGYRPELVLHKVNQSLTTNQSPIVAKRSSAFIFATSSPKTTSDRPVVFGEVSKLGVSEPAEIDV